MILRTPWNNPLTAPDSIPAFLRLSPEETAILTRHGPVLASPEQGEHFTETFYAWMRHTPNMEHLLRSLDAASWARLRAGQARNYQKLLSGKYDQKRRAELHHLGAMHMHLGLPSEWLNGAYALYMEHLQAAVNALKDLPAKERQVLRRTLRKRVELDRFWHLEGFQAAMMDSLDTQKRFYHALAEVQRLTRPEKAISPLTLLQEIAERLTEIIQAPLVWIGCLDPRESWVRIQVAAGSAQGYTEGLQVSRDPNLPEGQGAVGMALRSGRPQIIADVYRAWDKNPQFTPRLDRAKRFGLGSSLAAAAQRQGGGFVTLSFYQRHGAFFPAEIAELAGHIVHALAAYLDHQVDATRMVRLEGWREAQRQFQQALLSQPDSKHVYGFLAENILRHTDIVGVDILLIQEGASAMNRWGTFGPLAETIRRLPIPTMDLHTLPGRAWMARKPQFRVRPAEDPDLPPLWREAPLSEVGAVGAWPIQLSENAYPVAVVALVARTEDTFLPELCEHIEEMIQATALALQRHTQQQVIEQVNHLYRALMAEGDLLLSSSDEHRLLQDTCHRLVDTGLFVAAWVGRPGDETPYFRYLASAGPGAMALHQLRIPVQENPGGEQGLPLSTRAWQSGRIQYNQDHLADPHLLPWRQFLLRYHWRSAAAIPVRRNGALWAVLVVVADATKVFQQSLLELLTRVAAILGHGLDEYDLRQALRAERDRQGYLALHDQLTDLPNRAYFQETAVEAIARARRENTLWAVGTLDLDGFKEVNDALGHSTGDCVLQAVATCLQASRRGGDVVTRLGGDEFGFHFAIQDPGDLATFSQRILMAIVNAAATVTDIPVSGSLGWAVFPQDGEVFDTLFAHADEAMYAAKDAGKSTFRLYSGPVSQQAQRRIRIHQRFPQAIAEERIHFFLQPQGDAIAARLDGVEMLARWRRPDGRWDMPGKFMPIVETDVHLIRGLGIWGLQEAMRLRERFAREGLDLSISLNIGAKHFLHPEFLQDMDIYCPDGSNIVIEITESTSIEHIQQATRIMEVLKARGFRLSMDDFGTGYSSLLYAAKLPFDEFKLDQGFIRAFRQDHASFAVVGAARLLAELAGRSLIAEGIATASDLALWMRMGGTRIQGYHLAPPLPENAFLDWHRWLLPLTRKPTPICPLEDLALLIYTVEDRQAWQQLLVRYAADNCPLGAWFVVRDAKYGGLPSFQEAKSMHAQLHRLPPDAPCREQEHLSKRLQELTVQLYQEVAARGEGLM